MVQARQFQLLKQTNTPQLAQYGYFPTSLFLRKPFFPTVLSPLHHSVLFISWLHTPMKQLVKEPKGISVFKDPEHVADTQVNATLNQQD